MSDNTELTFIRCPSCRSLVPALSTRCRMCGASLDKNAAAPKATKAAEPAAPVATASAAEERDPLADYLSELGEDATEAPASPAPKVAKAAPVQSDDGDDQDDEEALNELEKLLEELKSAEEGIEEEEVSAPAPVKAEAPKKVLAKKPEPVQQDIDDTVDEFSEIDEVAEDFAEEEPVAPAPLKAKPASNGFKKPAEIVAKSPLKPAPLKSQPVKVAVKSQAPAAKPVAPRVTMSKPENTQVAEKQSLIGWFVSYNNQLGSSMELRSGRYFISRNQIKDHDILIDDSSVSTPHALLVLDSETGIHVQDLLSEEGVFVRRAGSAEYEQVADTEVLENGDWIRFGKVEYLLVLVPTGAR